MSSKKLNFEELVEQVSNLSLSEMRKLNTAFNRKNNKNLDERIERLIMTDLENRMIEFGINQSCPKCGSTIIVKNGKRNHVQRLECKECGNNFTYFTDTFLEKTKYHYDFWVELCYLMLNHISLKAIKKTLEEDFLIEGITERTILNWKLKIMTAAMHIEQPKLTGIVEVDETYLREGQKGKSHLIDPLNPTQEREARRKKRTSKFGVMGPEFSNVIVAIDRTGHCVSKIPGTGVCSYEAFEQLFLDNLENCTWLCTDANSIYNTFCEKHSINHYVRPSDYLENLYKGKSEGKTEEELYRLDLLDYIKVDNKRNYPFKKFDEIKKKYSLSLARVNEFHSVLREHLETRTHGVSITYIKEYVAWETYLKNFAADHGHIPSTRKDAEIIIEELLKKRVNIKIRELYNRKADFSNIKTRYLNSLKEITEEIENEKQQKYHLTPEDIGPNFNVDEFLKTLPLSRLREIAKYCKVPNFSVMVRQKLSWKLRKAIMASPDCHEAIIQYIINHPKREKE